MIRLQHPVDGVSDSEFAEAKRHLGDLAGAAAVIGDPRRHPWRDTTRTFYTADDREDLLAELARLGAACDAFAQLAPEVGRDLGLPGLRTIADAERASAVADVLERSPGAALEVLQSELWNSPPPQAMVLLRLGQRAVEGKREALERFRPAVLEHDHDGDADVIERMHRQLFRMLNGNYRRIRKAWIGLRLPGYAGTLGEQVEQMRAASRARRDLAELQAADESARQLFGALWNGEASDWNALARYVEWVVEFRSTCITNGLQAEAAQRASRPHPDVSSARTLASHAKEAGARLTAIALLVGWPEGYLRDEPIEEIAERAAVLGEPLRRVHSLGGVLQGSAGGPGECSARGARGGRECRRGVRRPSRCV